MRRLLLVLGVLAVLAGALVVALPWVARPLLAGMLTVRLGRPVTIGALQWDLSTGTVVAGDLVVGAPPEQLAVARLTVGVDLTRLARREVVLDRVHLEAPTGTLRLETIAADAEDDDAGPRLYVPVAIRELRADDGRLVLHGPGGTTAQLVADELVATDIALGGGSGRDVALTATLAGAIDGVPLHASAEVRVAEGERVLVAQVRVRDYPVPDGLLPLPAPLTGASGTVTAEATLHVGPAPDERVLTVDARVARARVVAGGAALAARAVAARAVRIDLAARRLDLGPVSIEEPELTADLDRLPSAAAAARDADAPGWHLRSDAVTVRGGRVRLRRGGEALVLRLASVRWDGLREAPAALAVRLQAAEGGGTLAADGTVRAEPLLLDLEVRAEALPVAPWSTLLAPPLPLRRGTVEGLARVRYDGGWRAIDGTLRAHDVHTAPPDPARPKEVMAVATADARFAVTTTPAPAVTIETLALSYPYVLALRRPDGIFPLSVFTAGAAPAPAAAAAGGAPQRPALRIARLTVEGGKVEFLDETVSPTFWTSLTSISAEAEDLTVDPLTIAQFTIRGLRDELSPVTLRGTLSGAGLAGEAEVRELLLDSLNPYVAPVLGYQLTSGRLTSTIRTRPAEGLLQATADVVLRGVDVEQTGRDIILEQSGVPLPVALGLLTGVGGSIDLTLPFSVDTSSGDVAVGSVVWQAVRKAIVSALSSPLRVLGSLFGLNGAPHAFAVDPVPFATGRDTLDEAGRARVGEIARILEAQQGLLLVLLPQITDEDIAAVGAGGAAALARARNAAVRDAFVRGTAGPALAASRILLADWTPKHGAEATGRPGVYVELQDAP